MQLSVYLDYEREKPVVLLFIILYIMGTFLKLNIPGVEHSIAKGKTQSILNILE